MLNGKIFYHGIIRKSIIAFGQLFSNIYIERRKGDSVNGELDQTLQIPIAYAPKEKWLIRLEQDPALENHTYTTLPRMSFEVTGYTYDSSRKVGKMQRVRCVKDSSSTGTLSPVPYNVDISLYILTKTQEDALQIIEQILPTFGPEYTLAVKAIPEMNIIQDIPITLNGISVSDEYDGDFQTRRFVTHTLTFTLKLNLFGGINANDVILKSNVANYINSTSTPAQKYTATGDIDSGNIIDGWQ